jgi:hypothetical protein
METWNLGSWEIVVEHGTKYFGMPELPVVLVAPGTRAYSAAATAGST